MKGHFAMKTGFFFIFLTIAFTAYGQLIIKHEITNLGIMPTKPGLLLPYLLKAFTNPKILSGILSAVLAMIAWYGALSRLDLSFAYPFMSLTFPLVIILAAVLFHEPFGWPKIAGTLMILGGLTLISIKG